MKSYDIKKGNKLYKYCECCRNELIDNKSINKYCKNCAAFLKEYYLDVRKRLLHKWKHSDKPIKFVTIVGKDETEE